MEAKYNVEEIHLAIQQFIEEKKVRQVSAGETFTTDDENQLLLSRLLSQLESLRGDAIQKEQEPPSEKMEEITHEVAEVVKKSEAANEGDSASVEMEEIVKELRAVKKQNLITHCLLSALIVLTVAWQLSEVSLILKIKNGFSNPFRSFGSMLTGMLKGYGLNGQVGNKESSIAKQPKEKDEAPSFPHLKISELPHVDFSNLDLNGEDD